MIADASCPPLTRGRAIRASVGIVASVAMLAASVGELAGLLTPWPPWLLSAGMAAYLAQLSLDYIGRALGAAGQERGP